MAGVTFGVRSHIFPTRGRVHALQCWFMTRDCQAPLPAPLLRDGLAGKRFQELRGHPIRGHGVAVEDGIGDLTH